MLNVKAMTIVYTVCWPEHFHYFLRYHRDCYSRRQTVYTHRASVHQAAKLVAALLRAWRKVVAAYCQVYDSRHLQTYCQKSSIWATALVYDRVYNKYDGPPSSRAQFTRSACHAAAAAIDRYSLPAPDLSNKSGSHRCCCRSTGPTDGRTDGHWVVL